MASVRKFVQLPTRLNSGPVIPSTSVSSTASSEESVSPTGGYSLYKNVTHNMQTSKGIQVGVLPASRINEWVNVVDVDGNADKNPIFIFPPTGQTILNSARYLIREKFANAKFIYDGNGNWHVE